MATGLIQHTNRTSRAQKQKETFEALISAAIQVVGEEGYAAASITKISAMAGVANGTFYNYFESRQDLFDHLLPLLGDRLLAHIRSRIDRADTGIDRERKRVKAYLEFLQITPGFIRIFHEAEVYSPFAHKKHSEQYYEGYCRFLKNSIISGEIKNFCEDDIDTLSFLLMGMQDFMGVMLRRNKKKKSIENMIEVYIRLISCGGLFASRESDS